MRTNIFLDDKLVQEAMMFSHALTKKEMIDLALQNYVPYLKRQQMAGLFGKVAWEGDLEKMREL